LTSVAADPSVAVVVEGTPATATPTGSVEPWTASAPGTTVFCVCGLGVTAAPDGVDAVATGTDGLGWTSNTSAPTANGFDGCDVTPEVVAAVDDDVAAAPAPIDNDDGWLNSPRPYTRADDADGYSVAAVGPAVGYIGTP